MVSEPRSATTKLAMSISSCSATSYPSSTSIQFNSMPAPSINHMISVKLTQENYLLWSAQILPYLRSQGLIGYVDGSLPAPSQTIAVEPTEGSARRIAVNPEYTNWYHQDQLVLSAIFSSVTEDVLSTMVGVTTARDAWSTLEKMFASSSRTRIMQIRMQLATIQKKDLSIADYFRKVKRLGDTLAAIGKRLEDEELIAYMLRGLGTDYDPLVTSITTRTDAYSISDVYAHMLSYEMRQEHNDTVVQVSSVNNVNRTAGRTSRGHGHGGGRKQGGRSNRPTPRGQINTNSSNNGPLCQICHKPNHDTLQCWHRFDQSYQADDNVKQAAIVTNGYSVDSNWYVDTGATDHITNDLERLTTKDRYTGGDQVHVANGVGSSHEESAPQRQM